jgi:hypothetical protein
MNQHILQLARQVCRTEQTGFLPQIYGLPEGVKYMEQFAALIIKECQHVTNATMNESIDLGRNTQEVIDWINNDIEKHFGINKSPTFQVETLESRSQSVENELRDLAVENCSIFGVCGSIEYSKEFNIGEGLYIGSATFDYGYDVAEKEYYVCGHVFTVKHL